MSERQIRRAHERQVEREEMVRGKLGRKVALASGAALGAAVIFTPAAGAETFAVSNLADDGEGSLRAALEDANQNGGEDDVVTFTSGLSGTITLESGDLDIFEGGGVDVQGPGAGQVAISGDGFYRAFHIYNSEGETVSISGLTLRDGIAENGGAIHNGPGGADEGAELILSDLVITGNDVEGGGENGAGVYSVGGSLTISRSVISNNGTDVDSGDYGGGVYVGNTDGGVVIQDTVISDNAAYDGAGIYATDFPGAVLIEGTTLSRNDATDDSGAMFLQSPDSTMIVDSTVSGNTSAEYGGGFGIGSVEGPISITNSTFSGNSTDERGGGFSIYPDGNEVTIANSTIVGNQADNLGGGVYVGGAADISAAIVSGNSADEGPDLGFDESQPEEGFTLGFSLIGDPSDVTLTESPAGSNLFGVDPLLGPLASNGGPTQTHLPAQTSPAIDQGTANGLTADQRGLARTGDASAIANAVGGDGTDIGAVELQTAACKGVSVFSITGTAGNDSLTGDGGSNAIIGGAGDDALSGADGNDCLFGDDGTDAALGGAGDDEASGGAGNDRLKGEAGNDILLGDAGADRLKGSGGKDKLKGGSGKDKLTGSGGKDKLSGQGGKDTLRGGGGKDKLKGGPGKDKIKPGGGKDKVNCGGGKDKVTAQPKDKVSKNCEKVVEPG